MMFNVEIKKSGRVKVLTLSGPLTIDHISEIKEAFLEAVSRFKVVRVSFENVSEVDFSFLQLLYAVKHSVQNKKKELVFTNPLPPALKTAAPRLGISLTDLQPAMGQNGE